MLQKLALLLTTFLSLTAFATQDFTCLEDAKKTGFIYDYKVIHENDEVIEFSFLTRFGKCKSGALISEEVKRDSQITRMFDDGWNIPFSDPIHSISTYENSSDNEYKIIGKIYKERAFEDKTQRRFGIHFRINRARHKFIYEVHATKKADGNIHMDFKNKKAFMSYSAY